MLMLVGVLLWGFASLYSSSGLTSDPAQTASSAGSPLWRLAKFASGGEQSLAAQAERGVAQAQFQLGLNYRDGQYGARDSTKAYAWLEKAATQGHVEAQFVLGSMHLAGHGALQSFPSAFGWFERAAQQNHADAQFELGKMYRRGDGIPVNLQRAYVWFNLAAAQGHVLAGDARDGLLSMMTADEVRAAQIESQEWRPLAIR